MQKRVLRSLPFALLIAIGAITVAGVLRAQDQASPAAPARKIVALKLMPESLTLMDARDVQHVLVLGETESKERVDLSASAGFQVAGETVSVSADGAVK